MASLTGILPQPRVQARPLERALPQAHSNVSGGTSGPKKQPPPYGSRHGWMPRAVEDFGDGGAFPEIHVAQYPLDMGRKKDAPSTAIVPIALDSEGKVKYDAILGSDSKSIVYSKAKDLVPKLATEALLAKPDPEEEARTTERTKAALEQILNGKLTATKPAAQAAADTKANEPTYIRYTPQGSQETKVIRMVEVARDPLEPPKFKTNKKIPRASGSPPPPVMHSPPRKLSSDEVQEWNIPPCISNWKNPRGYTIALDKRLASDGRGLQDYSINDNFAKFADALYTAEKTAREDVTQRALIREALERKKAESTEEMLRKIAQETREKRAAGTQQFDEEEYDEEEVREKRERDRIREERKRDRESERRKEAMGNKKSKLARDDDRDVSERIALGEAPAGAGRTSEAFYDQRLFNQSQGMDSGFGTDDSYNIYDRGLFQGGTTGQLYRPKRSEIEEAEGDRISESDMKKITDTSRFRPDKAFGGAEATKGQQPRNAPVEFEKVDEADPFGLEELISQAKSSSTRGGGSNALDRIGQGQLLAGSAGGGVSSGGPRRSAVDFESSGKDSDSRGHDRPPGRSDRDRGDRDRERDRDRDRDHDRERDRDRGGRDRGRDDDRDRRRDRSRDRSRDRDRRYR